MMKVVASRWLAAVCCLLLVACGGGGGGGAGAGASSSSAASLTFDPQTVSINVESQKVATVSVRAAVLHSETITGEVWVDVEDSERVLTGGVDIAAIDTTTFSATFHTSPSLGLGHHTGSFKVYLCKDTNCAAKWAASPSVLAYDIDVTPAPLSATAASVTSATIHQGGSVSDPILVDVQGVGLHWSASSTAAWLQVDTTAHADNARVTAQYSGAALPVGNYADAITIRSDDGQTTAIPVHLQVIATSFTMLDGVPTFSAINGAPIAPQNLSFALDNAAPEPWTMASSASWMQVSALSGTTPAVVTLQPHPEWNALASGEYDDALTLSSGTLATSSLTSRLSLTKPTLSVSDSAVYLGGQYGRGQFTVNLPIALNTGTNSYPATVAAPAWVSASAPATLSNAGGTAAVAVIPSLATPGSSSGTLRLSAQVNGDVVTTPVTVNLNLDQQRLLPSAWAVAFASSPTGTVTTRTVTIGNSFGAALPWAAVSDAAWLSVTTSGVTGGNLVLAADPSLAPVGASSATVHVTSTTAGVATADIRVGLWKDATGLVATSTLPVDHAALVADRILPYVYAVASNGTDIEVYNAYAATHVATIANVGSALSTLAVSADGRRLFALDSISNSVQVVDLSTRTKTASWSGTNQALRPAWSMAAIRPSGVDVVVIDNGVLLAEGQVLSSVLGIDTTPRFSSVVISENQRAIVTVDNALMGYMDRRDVDYSVVAGGLLFTTYRGSNASGLTASPVALDPDGHALYTASQSRCLILDGETLLQTGSLPGGAGPTNNVLVTPDHRPVCGTADSTLANDLWVHSASGVVTHAYKVGGAGHSLRNASLVATPDGLVLAVLTDDPKLAFIPIGPP